MGTNMIVSLFLFICMYPSVFIIYFMLYGEGKASRGTLFGIRYSRDWLSDTEIQELEQGFSRKMKRYLLIFVLIPFVTLPIPYMSVSITIWLIWLFAAIIVFMLPYAQGYNHLHALKEKRLKLTEDSVTAYYELKGAGNIRTIKWYDFTFPLVLSGLMAGFSLLCFHGEQSERGVYGSLMIIFLLCNLTFYACAVYMDRMKTQVISSNSDVNVNYARATKNLWKKFWVINTWAMSVYMAVILICLLQPSHSSALIFHVILWGSVVICLLMLALCLYVLHRRTKLDENYHDKMDIPTDNDEKNWIGGILYYNPNDRHTMVNKKMGIGTTVNMATPAGKITTAVGGLVLLSIPILCIWLILEEFTPLSLTLQNNILTAEHVNTDYAIPVEDIQSVTLMTELPKSTKVNGTNMGTLEKGVFRNSADGRVREFLNPRNSRFLRIETQDSIYYMSCSNDEETMAIYEQLSIAVDISR